MRRLLVGGAIRDRLLGLPIRERDWLVLDTDEQSLLRLGFQRVGRHFPVFLDPQLREEHALPRGAFEQAASMEDQIEQDLQRRDLTINAIAEDEQGVLIDPCDGQADLRKRLLRHTPAFAEDPLRLLRVARFAAYLQPLGFSIAPETLDLMRDMVERDLLETLPGERLFGEFRRALQTAHPRRFIEELRACGALQRLLPEVDCLFGVPQPAQHHPEIDTGLHTLMVLDQACLLSQQTATRMAALLHDLGKGLTPAEEWPRHIGHEERGVAPIQAVAERLNLPKDWRDLASAIARQHLRVHRALELRPKTLLKLLDELDALRRPERFEEVLIACEADARGRTGFEQRDYDQRDYLSRLRQALSQLDNRAIAEQCDKPEAIAESIRRAQLACAGDFKQRYQAGKVSQDRVM